MPETLYLFKALSKELTSFHLRYKLTTVINNNAVNRIENIDSSTPIFYTQSSYFMKTLKTCISNTQTLAVFIYSNNRLMFIKVNKKGNFAEN